MSAPEDEDGDELALALGRHVALSPEGPRPRAWEAVLRGEASLEQVAASEGVELERARAYFTPLEPERVASIVDAVLAASSQAEPAAGTQAEPAAAPVVEPASRVVELASRRRSSSGAIVIGSLLALAAGLALWWAWPRGAESPPGGGVAVREPMPGHALEVGGWLKEVRAEPDPATPAPVRYRYAPDGEFEWLLRPAAGIAGALVLHAYVLEPSPRRLALDDMVTIATSGAIRIAGTIDRLGLAPGQHTIVLIVARPDALPDIGDIATPPATDSTDSPWRAYRIEIEI